MSVSQFKVSDLNWCRYIIVNVHLPGLQVLNARQHVQVTCRVLLDYIHDIIRPQALFEPPL